MGRRVWASDLHPSTPTLPIHQHDATSGWPEQAPRRVDFVLLDPPYWKQAAGRYSDSTDDLGNMDLDGFYDAWSRVVKHTAEHLTDDGKLAFIVSPAENRDADQVEDLAFGMATVATSEGLRLHRRIIVTYSTQQATGQQVEWARRERKLLKLYRDLVVLSR
jgi:tRNA1(Val) A37 N6-methylase TrmN6